MLLNFFTDTLPGIWSSVWPYLLAVLLFGILIMIHEFGHFAFAKLFKVRVNEFALGMGPVLLKKKKGETQYALRLFPIGGFVNMEGENEESDDECAFQKKPCWQRFIIVAAGAVLNLILGLIVFAVVLSQNELQGTRIVNGFAEDAVSVNYGLKDGDEILKVNNTRIYSYTGISYAMVRDEDNKLDMTVRRDGQLVELKGVQFAMQEIDGRQYMIWDFKVLGKETTVPLVLKNAVMDSISTIQLVRLSLTDICTGKYGLKDLSGPVGTISIIAETTSQGADIKEKLMTALTLLSYITINVGVFNLLPIPALDGGRLFFIIIEAIRRKPINRKYEAYVHAAGLVLLLAFMAVITISDIYYRVI